MDITPDGISKGHGNSTSSGETDVSPAYTSINNNRFLMFFHWHIQFSFGIVGVWPRRGSDRLVMNYEMRHFKFTYQSWSSFHNLLINHGEVRCGVGEAGR